MADIRLAKPVAGTTQTVPSAPDGRFIFDFPADAATLTRNGDDLVLSFEDGSSIRLQGFYTTYSKEDMPSFQVEGVEISGQDFFAALGEDLMPAAGPAAGSSASRGGRYNEYGGSDLLDGIDHLGRLDIGFDGGTQLATDTVEPSAPEVGAINERVKETTTVKLSVTPEDVMEGEAITYTATLVDENGNAVVNKGGDIIVSLGNGETIVIASGESSGTSAPVPTREDEAYVQGKETVSNQITDVSQDEGTSNFEHLVADETLVEVVVKDDNDTTTVSIATSDVLEGSESVVFDIQLSNKPDPSYEGATTVQVKVGETIYDVTVDADGRGTLTVPNPNGEDAYKDGSSITATVTGVTGGNYEKVEAGQSATANITDTIDTTTVQITTSDVLEGSESVVFDIQLS
ncbi:immunoglobulin-like domain-containing protein, partial [Desulfovibrio piger]|uniref:immunoglobulin-like domain-containing protein n=1 Tax=Desulfovibrio piger TaxID=901 RepID=UPI0034C615CF